MTLTSILATVGRYDRLAIICGLLLTVCLSWAYLLSGAGTMQEMGGMLMPMSPAIWTTGHVLLMFVMWSVMMAAMMLPAAAPMILLHATIDRNRRARGGAIAGGAGMRVSLFAAGYLVCWIGFSSLAVVLQYGLEKAALLSRMMQTTNLMVAAIILIAAGCYQFSPLKQSCLRHCRSPLDFLVSHWRDGRRGAFIMGLQHGMYCLGCCWMLMLLLFVGGVMNLAWITALAAFVVMEKIVPRGHHLGKVAGALLIAWGAGILFGRFYLPG